MKNATLTMYHPERGRRAIIRQPNMLALVLDEDEIAARQNYARMIGEGWRVIGESRGDRDTTIILGPNGRPAAEQIEAIQRNEDDLNRRLERLRRVDEPVVYHSELCDCPPEDDLQGLAAREALDAPQTPLAGAEEGVPGGEATPEPLSAPTPAPERVAVDLELAADPSLLTQSPPAGAEPPAPALLLPEGPRIVVPEITPAAPIKRRKGRP
jgi:hypothetical protein